MLSRYVVSQVKHNSYFLVGLGIGLWLSLAVVPLDEEPAACAGVGVGAGLLADTDEFSPAREERGGAAGATAGRSVQRPRYYSTELGMRGGLLAGVLSSEGALGGRGAALNRTAARLQPALRFFITASELRAAPGRANVVGFTDTREMLKPFHALKYLADNYLEEFDFFFLVSDASFVNARRLTELVARLSVSQDVYMGAVADDDTHYCTLEGGILLSNSVLRAVHGELDWCVRNSYSPHHHENLGRCVLHAAHVPCAPELQGQQYVALRADAAGALRPALADAVTAHPVAEPARFHELHAYVSRVYLERAAEAREREAAAARRSARRHPRGYRNVSWPPALRADAGLAPLAPPSRFDHLRWTRFNATHALMPDEHRAAAPLPAAYRRAVAGVVREARAWAARAWGAAAAVVEEGAWCWEPPRALRYRLLLRPAPGAALRQLEATRALGAARLAPARYVTESARVHFLLPLPAALAAHAPAFLQRYDAVCLQRDTNTALTVVLVRAPGVGLAEDARRVHELVRGLRDKYRGAALEVLEAEARAAVEDASEAELLAAAGRAALAAVLPRLARGALLLLAAPHMEWAEEFVNRARMAAAAGEQWFAPLPFARHAQYAHPRFLAADGGRPQTLTGRFAAAAPHLVLAFYCADYIAAAELWRAEGRGEPADADAAAVLARAPLRVLRAPEPALLLQPREPPCGRSSPAAAGAPARAASGAPAPAPADSGAAACLRRTRARGFSDLQLGARHSLAKLLLETQAEAA